MNKAHYIDFNRDWCSELSNSGTHEWLVTNGIGGYASGTVAGLLTRRYHGLLIAALDPPIGRKLLLSKLDETATYNGQNFQLFSNRWANGDVTPDGHHYIERFHLEGTTPVWTYSLSDAQLQKRVWMQPGENTTYIHYDLTRAIKPVELEIKAIVNFRDHHANTRSNDLMIDLKLVPQGIQATAPRNNFSFFLLTDKGPSNLVDVWYEDYFLSQEAYRGLSPIDDNLAAGIFRAGLRPGDSLTLVATTNPEPTLDGKKAYSERRDHEDKLIDQSHQKSAPEWVHQLILAADQFIVARNITNETSGRSVIAGYHWFGDWGRDTMISLPGLTLTTGRQEVAGEILRTFARFIDQGMLPNNFPEAGEKPGYNTVDATLWYFQAVRAYYAKTRDKSLLRAIFPKLKDIIRWHERGTRYNIHLDPEDGLVYAGEESVQLTWMDAKVDEWVVTPRIGKPIEINALWYNALRNMVDFAAALDEPAEQFRRLAKKTRRGFARYWNQAKGYCFDVLDGPGGNDPSLRPNQLFAVALRHATLTKRQQRAVVEICALNLWTPRGLRTLATTEPAYIGVYGGDQRQRDGAYHQGTVWGWLIGPFVSAHLRVYREPKLALSYLIPLVNQMKSHGLGNLSEIFDGDPPFRPRGCIAQAWSVAEVLRAWQEISQENE